MKDNSKLECTSTHCERRQECAAPRECTGDGKRLDPIVAAMSWITEAREWLIAKDLDMVIPKQGDPTAIVDALSALRTQEAPPERDADVVERARKICAKIEGDIKGYQYLDGSRDDYPMMLAVLTALAAPQTDQPDALVEVPEGAIENGRAFFMRLQDHYNFTDEHGHRLGNCSDFHEAQRCFEHLASFAALQSTRPDADEGGAS